jgi:hypothetical protein
MVTAIQSAHKSELGARLGKRADHGLSGVLDTAKRSSTACQFECALRERIVGQEEAVQALVDLYQMFCAGLHCPGRPVGNLLFLDPRVQAKRARSRPLPRFCSETVPQLSRWIARNSSTPTKLRN